MMLDSHSNLQVIHWGKLKKSPESQNEQPGRGEKDAVVLVSVDKT